MDNVHVNRLLGDDGEFAQYGSGARGSNDAANAAKDDPAGRPSQEPKDHRYSAKDMQHLNDTVHFPRDSNNTLVTEHVELKKSMYEHDKKFQVISEKMKDLDGYEKRFQVISKQLVETRIDIDQQIADATINANSLQHVFDAKNKSVGIFNT